MASRRDAALAIKMAGFDMNDLVANRSDQWMELNEW